MDEPKNPTRREVVAGIVATPMVASLPLASAGVAAPVLVPDDGQIHATVQAISELMTRPQLVGLDFADYRAFFGEAGGVAVCGHGIAEGPGRAARAAEAALADLRGQLAALRGRPSDAEP